MCKDHGHGYRIYAYLKEIGLTKIQAIKIISNLLEIDSGDAKRLVYNSKAWSDVSISDDEYQSDILKLIRKVR